jgi:hypothetical protein
VEAINGSLDEKRAGRHEMDWDQLQHELSATGAPDAAIRREADSGDEKLPRGWFDEGMSPEEWATRSAHNIVSFSFGAHRYRDAALEHGSSA